MITKHLGVTKTQCKAAKKVINYPRYQNVGNLLIELCRY